MCVPYNAQQNNYVKVLLLWENILQFEIVIYAHIYQLL